ncbi:isochorismatase family protein [Burkholderia orbicola]|uniref:isochorismatase family protein n=1 Tax=Burkholderia orbicola TaxID=2978683 RepID=UPI0035C74695
MCASCGRQIQKGIPLKPRNFITRRQTSKISVGVTTGVCITSTAREVGDRGLNVLVISDCCAEPDPLGHEMPYACCR